MRKLSLSLAAIAFAVSVRAEAPDYRFGKVSEEELRMEIYEPDPDAEAVVLYEKHELRYDLQPALKQRIDYFVRIKILKQEGTRKADVSLPYIVQRENYYGLDAVAYNLVDGKIVRTPLKKQYIFREEVSEKRRLLKFSVPEVRPGTVVEYRYSRSSDYFATIPPIRFQHDIPVARTEATAAIPEFFRFNINMKGYERIAIHEDSSIGSIPEAKYTYNVREIKAEGTDIPALKKEPQIWCLDDFRTMLEFELSQIALPFSTVQNFATSWKDVNKTLSDSPFDSRLRMNNPLKEEVAAIQARKGSRVQTAHDILRLVQSRIKWDERYRLLADAPRDALKKGTGSSAEINFVLAAALRDAGFEVTPILLNPRQAGRLPYTHATIDRINTFILRIRLDDGSYAYLDGTDPAADINLLPTELLVDRARIYGVDGPDGWCDLSRITMSSQMISMVLTFNEESDLTGQVIERHANQQAMKTSKRWSEAKSQEEFVGKLEKERSVRISELKIDGSETPGVMLSYRMSATPEIAGDFIYLNATVIPFMSVNEFKSPERKLPVEFSMPILHDVRGSVKIPDGYVVEEMPRNAGFTACDGGLICRYTIQAVSGYVQFNLRFQLKRAVFLPTEYADLKTFFGMVVDMSNSKIVLRKQE